MNSVSNPVNISYCANNIGEIKPPDKLLRYKITDAELEDKFQSTRHDVTKKEKHYSFESRKNTPFLVKLVFGLGLLFAGWHGAKRLLRK